MFEDHSLLFKMFDIQKNDHTLIFKPGRLSFHHFILHIDGLIKFTQTYL